jgi:hypothetical protein
MQYALAKHSDLSGSGVISDWYEDELSDQAQAEFDRVMRSLANKTLAHWDRPQYGIVHHGRETLGEIRFSDKGKKEYRPMGVPVPREWREESDIEEFVIVVGAFKKMKMWTPRSALDTAAKRIRDIRKNGRRNLREYTSHLEI